MGCGHSDTLPMREGHCYEDTAAVVLDNLAQLNVTQVDLTLLHSPPCVPNVSWAGRNITTQCLYLHARDAVTRFMLYCAYSLLQLAARGSHCDVPMLCSVCT